MPPFVRANQDKFTCDMVLSADGGQWDETQPELAVGLRGLCAMQINVTGPNRDVHSGMAGGAIQNPIHALVRLLDSMRSPAGKVLVEGFYAGVLALTPAEREQIAAIPYNEETYKAALGLSDLFGEPGFSTRERTWARPTLELNGIWGGFQGKGTKTVIPSTAHAKITCRLVADQDPNQVIAALQAHIAKHTPAGVTVTVEVEASVSKAYLMAADHPGNQAARDVHLELYGKEPYYARSGGSIPFCALFKDVLGVYTVNFGFALPDERQHSPNEFFRLKNFELGQKAYCLLLLNRLAQ